MIPETLRKMNAFSSSNKPAVLGPGGSNQLPYFGGGWHPVKGAGIAYESEFIKAFNLDNDVKMISAFEPVTILTNQISGFLFYPDPVNIPALSIDNLYTDSIKSSLVLPVNYFYNLAQEDKIGNNSSKITNFIFHSNFGTAVKIYIDKPITFGNIGVVNKALLLNQSGGTCKLNFFMPDEWCNSLNSNTGYPLQEYGGIQVVAVSLSRQQTVNALENDYTYLSLDLNSNTGVEVEYYWTFENIPLTGTIITDIKDTYTSSYDKLYNLKLVVKITNGYYTKYAVK